MNVRILIVPQAASVTARDARGFGRSFGSTNLASGLGPPVDGGPGPQRPEGGRHEEALDDDSRGAAALRDSGHCH